MNEAEPREQATDPQIDYTNRMSDEVDRLRADLRAARREIFEGLPIQKRLDAALRQRDEANRKLDTLRAYLSDVTNPLRGRRQYLLDLIDTPSPAVDAGGCTVSPTGETHACPPMGSGLTPCCGQTPFSLPAADRITNLPTRVTCQQHGAENRQERT